MRFFAILWLTVGLSGCNQSTPRNPVAAESPQTLMVHVAKQVQACWFKKPDPSLKGFRMASEVNSYAGRPRILIVPKNNPEGLPKLVAQAEKSGGRVRFSSFGPLLASGAGPQLQASLNRWASGSTSC